MIEERIITVIKRLQTLNSLQSFYLAGGVSLSLRFKHRESIDIDLFCEKIIGLEGYNIIEKEIREVFPNSLFYLDYPVKESDEQIFMRFTLALTISI